MKKWIAFGLIAMQVLGSSVFAATGDIAVPNSQSDAPEKALLESLFQAESQSLSQGEFVARMNANLSAYSRVASPTGQQARMEQALVDLKIYTPEQAHSFIADSQAAIAKLMAQAQASADPQTLQSSVKASMNELAALHPAGAQFSEDDAMNAWSDVTIATSIIGLGGITSVIVGGLIAASGNVSLGRPMVIWGATAAGIGALNFMIFAGVCLSH